MRIKHIYTVKLYGSNTHYIAQQIKYNHFFSQVFLTICTPRQIYIHSTELRGWTKYKYLFGFVNDILRHDYVSGVLGLNLVCNNNEHIRYVLSFIMTLLSDCYSVLRFI